jgi:hypothetical protein
VLHKKSRTAQHWTPKKTMTKQKKKRQKQTKTRGVSHCGLAIYIKKYLTAKKKTYYGNSNLSPCKNIIFQKSSKRNKKPSQIL